MFSYASSNQKSFNLSIDSLEQYEQSYYGDKYIQDLMRETSDHVQSEIENYIQKRLNDKYLVFTSKINFNNYDNNVESLIFAEKVLLNDTK